MHTHTCTHSGLSEDMYNTLNRLDSIFIVLLHDNFPYTTFRMLLDSIVIENAFRFDFRRKLLDYFPSTPFIMLLNSMVIESYYN